jgi:Phytanoyl-CoA dioxygenase (PhyH)
MPYQFDLLDPEAYHRDVLPKAASGPLGVEAARDLAGVAPLGIEVEGTAWTYRSTPPGLSVEDGDGGAPTVVAMSRAAWSDLAQLVRTAPALMLAGELTYRRGGFEHLARWEPALRAVYSGIPIYDPGAADLTDRGGQPLDLSRVFTPGDDHDELAHFLDRAGYLHVAGVFSELEITGLNLEVDRLAAGARPGDGRSWWAEDDDGEDVLCRLVYTSLGSNRIAGIEDDPRLRDLVALTGLDLRPAPDRMEGHSVLLKVPGRLRGLANIPWHVDCGLGGHPLLCPAVAIGIQLTDADAGRGRIEAIAGSHGRTCRYGFDQQLDSVPRVGIDTNAGDVTVHFADLMHASPPPRGTGGRRVLYVSYYPAALFEWIGPGQALNDLVRERQVLAYDMSTHGT